jgi:CDP-Glycerol:Poly(glycerophosphate) glycerophosphotransferase
VLAEILEDRFAQAPFDALVVPSDVFFYVRAAPAACHRIGVPFLCAQKETTISPNTMREHAERVRRFAPPIADHMTVCSEHHKQFWVRAGAQPATITVTGQPRFDMLCGAAAAPRQDRSGPTVLFLSYFVDAYHPSDGQGEPAWARMHRETEEALWALAREGWRVQVKPHPQQPVGELRAQIRAAVGPLWGERVILVDPVADVRPLLLGADVVVGFQSTAMLEAMVAGRPTLYTAWDAEARRLSAELIPFAEWGDVIDVVTSAGALADTVRAARGRRCTSAELDRRRAIAGELLGPLDGQASRRTLATLGEQVRAWERARDPQTERRRAALAAQRRQRALRVLRRRSRTGVRRMRRRVGALLGR